MLVSKVTALAFSLLVIFASVSLGAAIKDASDYFLSPGTTTTPKDLPLILGSQRIRGNNHESLKEERASEEGSRKEEKDPTVQKPDRNDAEGKEHTGALVSVAGEEILRSFSRERCIVRSVPPDVIFPDAFQEYRRSLETSKAARMTSAEEGLLPPMLPEYCYYMERQKQNVMCSGPNITTIPDFEYSRNINSLHFSGTSILRVTDLDPLPRSLEALHFSNGMLMVFNGINLGRVSGLEMLSLDSNSIESWSFAKSFASSSQDVEPITIRTIDLSNNRISYPPEPYGDNEEVLPFLETLVLNHNPLCKLPSKLFRPLRSSNVTRLYLKNCSINEFNDNPLSYFPNLEVLDLTSNQAINKTELTQLLQGLGHLRELYLGNNNYQAVPTNALSQVNGTLETLDLHSSTFTCLDNSSFPVMPRLTHLNLMYCRISAIRENTFEGFPALLELNLDGNSLVTIPSEVLLPSLQKLTLNDNPRDNGNGGDHKFSMADVSFQGMTNLRNITFNKIILETIETSYFNDLYNLEELSLIECGIGRIENFSFRNLTKLRRLYLSGNNLENLYNNSLSGLVSLIHLDLSGNKLDMTNRRLRSDMTHETSSLTDPIPSEDLRFAPDSIRKMSMSVPFGELVNLRTLNLSENKIRDLFPELFDNLTSLHSLDLNNNRVSNWKEPVFTHLSNLTELYFRENFLSTIEDAMETDFSMDSLKIVDLDKNNFRCDCSINKFNRSLNTSYFLNWPYECNEEDKHPIAMDEYIAKAECAAAIEPVDPERNSVIIIGATLAGLLLVASVMVYRKRWYVRYFVYTVRMRGKDFKEDSDKYRYDTFVCYSQTDRQWVYEHLVAKLEDGGRYRVCIHDRDFTVGQEITDNIITSVERSRKVVVVLSPSFIRSSWCMFELQMASNKILDERKSKLILLLLDRIPEEDQPKKLRLLLKTRTYIEWTPDIESQKLFWARLLRAIAKSSESEAMTTSTKL